MSATNTMITLSDEKLLTDSEFRRLRDGSYEDRIGRIREIVVSSASDHFVEGVTPEVVATYSNRAVVISEGQFFDVQVETSNAGEYRVVGVKPLEVEAYDQSDLGKYVQKEASRAVELFLRGSTESAVEHMLSIVPYVGKETKGTELSLEALECVLNKETLWKELLVSKRSEITQIIESALGELEECSNVEPKFRTLHECYDQEKLEGYASLVNEDTEAVFSSIESLLEDSSEALEVTKQALEGEDVTGPLEQFSLFFEALVDDLKTVHRLAEACRVCMGEDVSALSRLHDLLIERLRPYDIGTRFAVAVAQQLSSEAK